ncbi:hypothetical protein [Ideonella oryzae]|uniref:Uncharacterized protein n=1 Tax=Ideonella oryzae TaxID=2937441 RepID=A0ABT1BJN7_9BURK|nr:hypothetical protein [Ideonella oryzae]MCO5976318.1 hypothetical protein [Ideonella oryzae]
MLATANPAEFRPAPGLRRGWLGVLALHLALLGLWRQALHQTEVAVPPAATVPLVWLTLPAPAAASPQREPTRPLAAPAPMRPRAPATERPAPPPAPLQWSAPPADALPAAVPAPSAPAPSRGRLLDSEATRAAIREAARQPLLSERAASATDISPRTQAQRLSEGVGQSAKSDCLRDTSPAGLLALPWLAARVISADCPR